MLGILHIFAVQLHFCAEREQWSHLCDFFVIKEIELFPDHKLTVFNRWGDTVFESLDYQNGWDGTYDGKELPPGTYLYVLLINALGEKQVIKSTITIVRE